MRAAPLAALLLGSLVVPAACSASDDATPTVTDAGADAAAPVVVSPADAGQGADGGTPPPSPPPPPAGCVDDADSNTAEAAPCVADSFAVFANAANGTDDGDGSQAHPKKTIAGAIAAAKASNKQRIYLCGVGPYNERVTLDVGLRILGGLSCETWTYRGERAKIAPTEPGPVIRVKAVNAPVLLADLDVVALDVKARGDGTSSIGVFAVKSKLHLTRIGITASDGAAGANGKQGVEGVYRSAIPPHAGSNQGGVCSCLNGDFTSGGSGELGPPPQNATQGQPIIANGTGQHGGPGIAGYSGLNGDDGPSGADAVASTSLGILSETDWLPHAGADATEHGKTGQGGGGGGCGTAPQYCPSTGGAGGGCGGCGSGPGTGGGGGGSSFALVLLDTDLSIVASTITAGAGGAGGKGGPGGKPIPGQPPGPGPISNPSLLGSGGSGGVGGGGAGGAGGLSAGILFKGRAPVVDAETLSHTIVGKPGNGGIGGAANGSNAGAVGKADKLLDYDKL